MARWLVRLDGDWFDLAVFPESFPTGDVHAIQDGDDVLLVGEGFERLPDAEAVRAAADESLVRMFAAASLQENNLRRPAVGPVIRERDDGSRDSLAVSIGGVEARARATGVSVATGGPPATGPTVAQRILQTAASRPHLENALDLFGNGVVTWSRLYRIVEEIEQDLGKKVDLAGFCESAERDRFRRTANTAEASGLDARHAAGRFDPPDDPMAFGDAVTFVRSVLVKAFEAGSGRNPVEKGDES